MAVATLLGLPAMFVWTSFAPTTSISMLAWVPVSVLLLSVMPVGGIVLIWLARDPASMSGVGLDEGQRQLRDRAWLLSYRVLGGLVASAAAGGVVLVLVLGRAIQLDLSIVSAVAGSVGVFLAFLPVAALAWLEPDATPEG